MFNKSIIDKLEKIRISKEGNIHPDFTGNNNIKLFSLVQVKNDAKGYDTGYETHLAIVMGMDCDITIFGYDDRTDRFWGCGGYKYEHLKFIERLTSEEIVKRANHNEDLYIEYINWLLRNSFLDFEDVNDILETDINIFEDKEEINSFQDIAQYTRAGDCEYGYSLEYFVEAIKKFEKEDNLILNPDFQRGHVWTELQQVKYIEYLLRGGSTGKVIHLNHPNWQFHTSETYNEFVCVDGLQRITAITKFVENKFEVFGKYYKDFSGVLRKYHEMRINVNNLSSRKEVLRWYIEMNEGGTPHTKEDINKVKKLLLNEI